jgi:nitrogen fixation-related uncharacterized protein
MAVGIIVFVAWMALEVVVIAASIAWGFENGQWKDIEEPKYRMLIDHELQPWPGRERPSPDIKQGEEARKPGGEA